jgi:ectoine hydrolase
MDCHYFTGACYRALQTRLPNARIVDSVDLVNWQRAVKSQAELEYMRKAGRIIERVFDRVMEVIKPGVRQCDVVAEIYRTATRGTDEAGGDYTAAVPLIGAGSDAAAPHLTWSDKPFRSDEGVMFELAGCHRRYHAPLSRTIFLGNPPPRFVDASSAVVEGIEAGLAVARPGKRCEDIALALYRSIESHGYRKDSRTGYSIGVGYPPDWGERTMSLRPGDMTELVPGMVFHFMPALWVGDWGMAITESIVITENGNECLANYPRRLLTVS